MKELSIKQKIMIIGIVIVLIAIAAYYFYTITKENDTNDTWEDETIIHENRIEEKVEEENIIIIHITGEVVKPGIVKLKEGSRIIDAIEAANGNTQEADLDQVNLAYVLEDGQKIEIPNKSEKEENETKEYITTDIGNTSSEKQTSSIGKEKKIMININVANMQDLTQLPGIGEATANKIIEYRNENGKFGNIEDIKNVSGIGDAKFNNIKDNITVK